MRAWPPWNRIVGSMALNNRSLSRLCFPLLAAVLLLAAPLCQAQEKQGKDELPPGAMYRFQSDSGSTMMTNTLPREAIENGYQVLDKNGRVIRSVEPAMTEAERQKLKARQQAERERERQQARDEELLRLYAGPDDARRARDRQIEALKLNISYTRNTIEQTRDKLEEEVSAAARYERQGKEVPESITAAIDRFQRQIDDQQNEIDQYQKDIKSVTQRFEPIIERLRTIAGADGPADGQTAGSVPENQRGE
jgi:chromosome segregation ATPase